MAKIIEFTKEDSDNKIKEYIENKDKVATIIGLFAKAKGIVFENNVQLSRFYARHLRKAQEIDCYSVGKIVRVMKYLLDNADYKWDIGTIVKHIDEDLDKLEGKEPIIQLTNGEKVFSVERLKQLERDGKIYYNARGWQEVGTGNH